MKRNLTESWKSTIAGVITVIVNSTDLLPDSVDKWIIYAAGLLLIISKDYNVKK